MSEPEPQRRGLLLVGGLSLALIALVVVSSHKARERGWITGARRAPASAQSSALAPAAATAPVASGAPVLSGRYSSASRELAREPLGEAGSSAVEAREREPELPKQIGTFEEWLGHYQGGAVDTKDGSPERKPPPPLGVLSDLPELPVSQLAFERGRELHLLELPSRVERVLTGKLHGSGPVWSADGRQLAFSSPRDPLGIRLFVLDFSAALPDAGGEPIARAVTPPLVGRYEDYAFSPNGDALVYVVRPATRGDQRPFVEWVELATGTTHRLYRGESEDDCRSPAWSPDGSQIVFAAGRFDGVSLHIAERATGQLKEIPAGAFNEYDSPLFVDSQTLLFGRAATSALCCREPSLVRGRTSGGAGVVLHQDFPGPGFLALALAPDRAQLAVDWSVRMGGFGAEWREDVTVLAVDGTHARVLAADYPRPFYSARRPSWAPDNRHLALELVICPYLGCHLGVYSVVAVDTTQPKPKLVYLTGGSAPAWRPAPAAGSPPQK